MFIKYWLGENVKSYAHNAYFILKMCKIMLIINFPRDAYYSYIGSLWKATTLNYPKRKKYWLQGNLLPLRQKMENETK